MSDTVGGRGAEPAAPRRRAKGYELTALVLNKRFASPTQQHVMAAFADYVGDDETAYPSSAALAAKTGYTQRTVRKALRALTQTGLLRQVGSRKCASGAVKVRLVVRAVLEALPDSVRRKRGELHSPQGVQHVHPMG